MKISGVLTNEANIIGQLAVCVLLALSAQAQGGGRLVATGGVTQIEGSASAEYRQKSDNLSVFPEDDYCNVFLALWPNKRISFTLAHIWLGAIADKRDQ